MGPFSDLWVSRDKYGKTQQGSGCTCIVRGRDRNALKPRPCYNAYTPYNPYLSIKATPHSADMTKGKNTDIYVNKNKFGRNVLDLESVL
jgi:hypothetical protein